MKFSIVTISFNQARFLEKAIISVLDQDHQDVEYIVVDPGSTDGSREIIERYRDKIDKIIYESDRGPADGLNKGFLHASGEILGFINADDLLLPGALKAVSQRFSVHRDIDVFSGHSWIIDEHGQRLRRFFSRKFSLLRSAYGAATLAQQSTFFRASIYRRSNGFNIDNRVAWDGELWIELAQCGARFETMGEMLACFRVYPETISSSIETKKDYDDYLENMFVKITRREKNHADKGIVLFLKGVEYLSQPRILIERLLRGPTLSGY